MWQAITAV